MIKFSADIVSEIEKAVVGKRDIIIKTLSAILSGGHILFEDYPGLGKTLLANSFAQVLGLNFKRIQFTPDLLPGDITGGYYYDKSSGEFQLRKGAIFTNILLADEINRGSPKTQSALLEAMQERQVTIEGETYKLPEPFIVFATQNPIEYEGTFPLPEAQLDRFMLKMSMDYPDFDQEVTILANRRARKQEAATLNRISDQQELADMMRAVESVHLDNDLQKYIVTLVQATREDPRIQVGSSPRGSLALMLLAQAHAVLQGSNFVLPDDIKYFASDALHHRMVLHPDFWWNNKAAMTIISDILGKTPVPMEH